MELGEGLTVITGETGAGKSILVDALALLAGGRGSSELVRSGAQRLTISGEFDTDAPARAILQEAGLPAGATVLLRREIQPDGRGRAYVDDEPAAVRTLAKLSERLLAIQGQNSELELADRASALEILDDFAGVQTQLESTGRAAAEWSKARESLESLEASGRDRAARLEDLDYQIQEIERVALTESEETDLSAERERLLHADRIRRAGETALAALSEDEGSAADRLGEAARAFAELAAIDPRELAHFQEAEELKRRVADLAAAARDAAGEIEADPDRLTAIETRREKIDRVKRRYGGTVPAVLAHLARIKSERAELSNVDESLDRRRKEEATARDLYRAAAGELSSRRASAAGRLSAAVERALAELAFDKARFRVALEPLGDGGPRPLGLEAAAFLFAPNPGEPEQPVERIASGGELSRLQLAIRCAGEGRRRTARALVFDEIDAGVGGRAAEVVGRKLRDLARREQVLCVTHVPQIAALADRHFVAEKREVRGRTIVSVRPLAPRDRVGEIARMLAGERIPESALKHARTLLEQSGK